MASCSEDDGDGDGSGSSVGTNSAKLGNKTFKVPYGFWHMGDEDSEEGEENVVMMEFYSYDVLSNKFPGKMSAVYIDFIVPSGQKDITSTVVDGSDYNIYVVHDATMSSSGLQAETRDHKSNPDMKIVRNGSKYSISIEDAKVSDGNQSYDFSFNFSGQLTHRQIAD